jgi:predicted component of type VI protein secretion system
VRLTLKAISYDGGAPLTSGSKTFVNCGGSVGRAANCDWTLVDPNCEVSGEHFRIGFRNNRFYLTDRSTNGSAIDDPDAPIAKNVPTELSDRNVIYVGAYKIDVRIEQDDPRRSGDDFPPPPGPGDLGGPDDGGPDDGGIERLPEPDQIGCEYPSDLREPDIIRPDPDPPEPASSGFPWETGDERPDRIDRRPPPPPQPAPSPSASPGSGLPESALAELERGLGVKRGSLPGTDGAILFRIGARFRRLAEVLQEIAMMRANVRAAIRVSTTVISSSGNNPIKFSSDTEQLILALLDLGGQRNLAGEPALTEILRDIQAHEMALMSGAQAALSTLLARLDPEKFAEAEAGKSRLANVLPAARKAAAWDRFQAEYERLKEEAEDSAHGPLARALARAYEDRARKL